MATVGGTSSKLNHSSGAVLSTQLSSVLLYVAKRAYLSGFLFRGLEISAIFDISIGLPKSLIRSELVKLNIISPGAIEESFARTPLVGLSTTSPLWSNSRLNVLNKRQLLKALMLGLADPVISPADDVSSVPICPG